MKKRAHRKQFEEIDLTKHKDLSRLSGTEVSALQCEAHMIFKRL